MGLRRASASGEVVSLSPSMLSPMKVVAWAPAWRPGSTAVTSRVMAPMRLIRSSPPGPVSAGCVGVPPPMMVNMPSRMSASLIPARRSSRRPCMTPGR